MGARLFEFDPGARVWREPAPPAQRQGIKRAANVVLTSQMKELINERTDLMTRMSKLEVNQSAIIEKS